MIKTNKNIMFKIIGLKIGYYRSLIGVTQEEFAEMASISKSTLSRIEQGRYNQNISISILITISEHLNIPISALFDFLDSEIVMIYNGDVKPKNKS